MCSLYSPLQKAGSSRAAEETRREDSLMIGRYISPRPLSNGRTKARRTESERRLLPPGDDDISEGDTDAVLIRTPGQDPVPSIQLKAKMPSKPSRIPSGGPRPRNDLSKPPRHAVATKSTCRMTIPVEDIVGGNFKRERQSASSSPPSTYPPVTNKRRKGAKPVVIDDSTDELSGGLQDSNRFEYLSQPGNTDWVDGYQRQVTTSQLSASRYGKRQPALEQGLNCKPYAKLDANRHVQLQGKSNLTSGSALDHSTPTDPDRVMEAGGLAGRSQYFTKPLDTGQRREGPLLQQQFISSDGRLRGTEIPSSSPDQLNAGLDDHDQSQSVLLKDFARSGSNTRTKSHQPWRGSTGFGIKFIGFGSHQFQHDLMGLVLDEAGKTLRIWNEAKPVSKFSLPCTKVRKVIYSMVNVKARVETIKMLESGFNGIDIEFKAKADCERFLTLVKKCNTPIEEKHPGHLNKLFAHRLEQITSYNKSKAVAIEAQPMNLQILVDNKRRREEQPKPPEKRQRRSDMMQGQQIPTPGQENEARKPDGIDNIAKPKNVFQNNNTHLARGRSSASRNNQPKRYPSPFRDEIPDELRYSRTHDMGPPWKHPLVYPKGAKKRATVDFDDLERLDDGQFLNDNLIEFYLRYLACDLERRRPEVAKKIYWFNTYFFATLTQTSRGKKAINFEGVKKWTSKIDIFNYDYVVVPINESAHWYVAIICNLPALERKPPETFSSVGTPEGKSATAIRDDDEMLLNSGKETLPDHGPREADSKMDEDHTRRTLAQMTIKDSEAQGAKMKDDVGFKIDPTRITAEQSEKQGPESKQAAAADETVDAEELVTDKMPVIRRTKNKKPKKYDPRKPAIITLDSLGFPHSPTTRVLKDYLRHEANDKRGGMEFDDATIQGTTGTGIPLQDNSCDCGLFLLGYMDKFIEDPSTFISGLLQKDFDSEQDWPRLRPNELRARIRELVITLHAVQEDERLENRKPKGKSCMQSINVHRGDTAKPTSDIPEAAQAERSSTPAKPLDSMIETERGGPATALEAASKPGPEADNREAEVEPTASSPSADVTVRLEAANEPSPVVLDSQENIEQTADGDVSEPARVEGKSSEGKSSPGNISPARPQMRNRPKEWTQPDNPRSVSHHTVGQEEREVILLDD